MLAEIKSLELDFTGYKSTNGNILYGIDLTPAQFFAKIENSHIYKNQIDILNLHWAVSELDFLMYVRPSTLQNRVWIDCRNLVATHNFKVYLPSVQICQVKKVLERSFISTAGVNSVQDLNKVLCSLEYPTLDLDFIPLIKEICTDFIKLPFQNNCIYYLSAIPKITTA